MASPSCAITAKCRACPPVSTASVATTAKPIDDGGARLLVEDDELEGAVVVAVLLSPDGRVIAQRRTVVGGEA